MTNDHPELHDLREVLERSFGDGPAMPTPGDRLASGRRSLRRRRLAGVVGSAAAVGVVVAASFAVLGGGGSGPKGADPVAPAPTVATPSAGSLEAQRQEAQRQEELDRLAQQAQAHEKTMRQAQLVNNHTPAALDLDGNLVVQEGWTVTSQVPEPMGYHPPEASLGVVVTDGDRTRWMLLTVEHAEDEKGNPIDNAFSTGSSSDEPGKGYSRFEDWLASMVALQGGSSAPPLVTVTDGDEVVAGPGSTLVDVQRIPVIDGYTSPGDRVAQVTRDGQVWFVVVRGHGSDAELITVDGAVLPESTLAALLTYIGQQVDSGEGVR